MEDRKLESDSRVAPSGRNRGRRSTALALGALVVLLAGCGGGSGNGGMSQGGGALSGTAVKGPVGGASMAAYAVTNGAKGARLGTASTDAQGRFTLSVGSYSGSMLLEMSGGTYADEATGSTMAMMAGDVMTAAVPEFDAGSTMAGIQVTPLTSMAQSRAQMMPGGMTAANVSAANAEVGRYFYIGDILHTPPMDPLVQGSGATATQDAKNYGMVMAAMSEYARSIGMTDSSGIVTAMMDDASDGVMNGMMGSTPISMPGMGGMGGMMGGEMMQPTSGRSGLADAMAAFIQDTSVNRSGVPMADMQPLIDKLRASSGILQ